MKQTAIRIYQIVLFLFCLAPVQAQNVKVLPADPAIKTAVMPNGMKCYIVTNPSLSGVADFALIQNTGSETIPCVGRERVVEIAREGLASYPRLLSPSVQDYFTSLGAFVESEGFVRVTEDATVYRFHNVNISKTRTALDSTLFVLMDMAGRACGSDDHVLRKWYTPSDQAIVIAGDIDAAKVTEKLTMLSYMLPASESAPRREYEWKSDDTVRVSVFSDTLSSAALFKALWRMPRTPLDMMNTLQPAVLRKNLTELSSIASEMISKSLKDKNIPYAEVRSVYRLPMNHLSDETFEIQVYSAQEDVLAVSSVVSEVMSSLETAGVSARDLNIAQSLFYDEMDRHSRLRKSSNARYIEQCVDAFLYNASLTTEAEVVRYMKSRSMSDSTRCAIFKSIVSAAISPDANLSLECRTGRNSVNTDSLRGAFCSGWEKGRSAVIDTCSPTPVPSLPLPSGKVRVRSVRKEYLSGGDIWTLSNGMRVALTKVGGKEYVDWTLAVPGGYGSVKDLERGEAAYLSEYLDWCNIAGVDFATLKKTLSRRGMTLELKVDHAVTTLSGRVGKNDMEYLVRNLLAVANNSVPDPADYAYDVLCEPLRLEAQKGTRHERMLRIDSLMCPDYRYSLFKDGLSDKFLYKAESFFKEVFSNMNSAILVLAGNVDEKLLKKALQEYAGGFRTSKKCFSRPVPGYQMTAGVQTVYESGQDNSVDIVMSAPVSLTAENYYMSAIASMYLRSLLSQAVTGRGLGIQLSHKCSLYPQERFSVSISLREVSVDGFAVGTSHKEPEDALASVRSLLKDLDKVGPDELELKSYKTHLKRRVADELKNSEFWLTAVPMRYLEGKDLVSGYEAKIDAVTVDDVKSMLGALSRGTRVEYIINQE